MKAETEKAATGEYEIRKTEFELTHCKIVNRQLYVKIVDHKVALWSVKDLQHSMLHLPPVGKRTFFQAWTSDPNIRLYDDVGLFPPPLTCPSNIFNMWTGFTLERVTEWTHDQDGLDRVRAHLLIMCGNEPAVADYMEQWIGQALQFPATKTISPCLISKQGAGKGSLIDVMRRLFGDAKVFETSKPAKDVWGPFNGLMQDAFIVNLDEISKKDTLEAQGVIKALITNKALTINRKGIDAYNVDSYHRFISTTNSEDPMPTSEDDRRMLIVRSSDELVGNKAYFKAFHERISDNDVAKTCFEYFRTLPGLEDFGSIKIPVTAYQTNLKELSKSPLELFMKDFTFEHHDNDRIELSSADVYSAYRGWCRDNMPDFKMITSQQLGVRIKNSPIAGIEKGHHTRSGETRVFDIARLKKYFEISDVADGDE